MFILGVKYYYIMQKTQMLAALLGIVSVVGLSPAFASGVGTITYEEIPWITGETVMRLTIDGHCGENTNRDLQVTFFDDYAHVLIYENGSAWFQATYNYDKYNANVEFIYDLVLFC